MPLIFKGGLPAAVDGHVVDAVSVEVPTALTGADIVDSVSVEV